MKRLVVAPLALASAWAVGCAGDPVVASSLANAMRPQHLPEVVACWEKEFEAAEFRGAYVAEADFLVDAKTSKIKAAQIRSLTPAHGTKPVEGRDLGPFKACFTAALNASVLPRDEDKDGPGFKTSDDLTVVRYRFAFTDASSHKSEDAVKKHAHVLIGPGKDRCRGLYRRAPPRPVDALKDDITFLRGRAESRRDLDERARELQKLYDTELELMERLRADAAAPSLAEADKKRLGQLIDEATASAKKTGARIGCSP